MYKSFLTNKCHKDLKKLDKEAEYFVRHKILPMIEKNPYSGRKLKGKAFNKFHKYSIKYKKVDYRVAYRIEKDDLIIIFVKISNRENFYKDFKRRV